MIKTIWTDTPKIIGFLIMILILGSILGGKFAFMLLSLLLIGQVIFHPEVLNKIPFFGGKA